jgi:hypothetical protein
VQGSESVGGIDGNSPPFSVWYRPCSGVSEKYENQQQLFEQRSELALAGEDLVS